MEAMIDFPGGMSEAEFDKLCRMLEDPAEAKGADKPLKRLSAAEKRRFPRPASYVGLPPEPLDPNQL